MISEELTVGLGLAWLVSVCFGEMCSSGVP